jgi:hypothetical protein
MRICTLSLTFVCCLALSAGCGDDEQAAPADRTERFQTTPLKAPADSGREKRSACTLLHPRGMRAKANDSTDLSICDWRGRGRRLQLVLDTAPRAQLRYYNQLAEQLQFYNADPQRRPYQVKHVGDDDAYGGAGAWWTRTKGQLVAYSDERILRLRAPQRRTAVRMARLAFRRLSEPAG